MDWARSTSAQELLEAAGPLATPRKLRLFACAAVREIWHALTDSRSRNAIIVAERYAYGLATREELEAAYEGACDVSAEARQQVVDQEPLFPNSGVRLIDVGTDAHAGPNAAIAASSPELMGFDTPDENRDYSLADFVDDIRTCVGFGAAQAIAPLTYEKPSPDERLRLATGNAAIACLPEIVRDFFPVLPTPFGSRIRGGLTR